MKSIAVEAKKTFTHGFVLNEADLRRFLDLFDTQLQKLALDEPLTCTYSVKFKNGVLAETPDIDQVLEQENSGSGKIVRLGIKYRHSKEDSPIAANLDFVNSDEDDEPGAISIRYSLRAEDRDWVFVTGSLLSERIEKIKRFAPNQLGGQGGARSVYRLLVPLGLVVVMLGFLFAMLSAIGNVAKKQTEGTQLSEILQKGVDDGSLKDPVAVLIQIQKHQESRRKELDFSSIMSESFLVIGVVVAALPLALLLLAVVFIIRYYPIYNFVWGDYVQEFQRRESARKFWFVVIGVGIVVSCIGGLIANRINFF